MPVDMKNVIASTFATMAKQKGIDKITVKAMIDACGISRQTFYYHFQDKYELINWIYYTEFLKTALENPINDSRELLDAICCYFYENREFYAKTFRIEGQNSFSDYFCSVVHRILAEQLSDIFPAEDPIDPYAEFYTDAIVCAIKKWLSKKDCIPPLEFSQFIQEAILGLSQRAAETRIS